MTPVQQSKGQREPESPWLGTCAAASCVITRGDVITHLRRAISEPMVPTTVLSGTHWRQRLERFINWLNDALTLFQKKFCLLLHCATTQKAWGKQHGFPWNGALFRQHILPDTSTLTTRSTCCSKKKINSRNLSFHLSPNLSGLHLNWINQGSGFSQNYPSKEKRNIAPLLSQTLCNRRSWIISSKHPNSHITVQDV